MPPGKRKRTDDAGANGTGEAATPRRSSRRVAQVPAKEPAKVEAGPKNRTAPKKTTAAAPAAAKKPSASTAKASKVASQHQDEATQPQGRRYWLMKAEPEDRFENGVNVKFSIDDLAAKTEPEGWEGIRNHVAQKHMRAMRAGELAFFYHSNCKVPGVAGVMQIVREQSPDESQFDAKHPYYDAKSSRDSPRWVWVHVRFVAKFAEPVSLKMLQAHAGKGTGGDGAAASSSSPPPLANLQTLRQTRLSVSEVMPDEWDYILGLADTSQQEIDRAVEKLGAY